MIKLIKQISEWLETRWVSPAYSGWILIGIAICFFGAATNTMAGWLYVISGTIFALLGLGAIIPMRSLPSLKIDRKPITPVSAGDQLSIELEIENPTLQAITLLQIKDILPYVLSPATKTAIEVIPPKSKYRWLYFPTAQRRGIYQWHEIQLRSGNPLGIFWCRRSREVAAKAIVYPTILTLTHCPLIDSIGQDDSTQFQSDRLYKAANEGITRTLRQYRRGDPTRLIHWRTSARIGELQVRELEIITGGEDVIICLDNALSWHEDNFENAVIVAASLYFYANRCQLNVKLWTATTGLIHGTRVVLETLAGINSGVEIIREKPDLPLIWITENATTINDLPLGSRWVLFPNSSEKIEPIINQNSFGLLLETQKPLQTQLQQRI